MNNENRITFHDPRELASKFSSKKDLVQFLKYNKGYFLPSDDHLTMRFMKDFLSGEKRLLKAADVMQFNVPYYEELSISKVFSQVKDDEEFMSFMNYYSDYQILPDRKYFYGVLGTLHPRYLTNIVRNANRARNHCDQEEEKQEKIAIREDIFRKIEQEPYYSKSRGKVLQMLKIKSKPRKQRQKRQLHEISQSFQEFKNSSNMGSPKNIMKEQYDMMSKSQGKRQVPDEEME